jgi:hypothetical protein
MPIADGVAAWIKVTLDVDNGAGGKTVRFFYAADQPTEPTSWTQLGTDVTTAGTTSLPAVTSPLYAGFTDGTTSFLGKSYRAIVRNGIGGTTVADIDFTRLSTGAETSFTATTGQTVTINRATSGRKAAVVVRPTILLGTDDYFEVPDSASLNFGASDQFSVVWVGRHWGTFVSGSAMIVKKTTIGALGNGWALRNGSGTPAQTFMDTYDGTTAVTPAGSPDKTAGALATISGVVNATQQATYYNRTTAGPLSRPANTLTNTEVMRIGRMSGAGTSYNDVEFQAAAVFRKALTAAEIDALCTYYGTA